MIKSVVKKILKDKKMFIANNFKINHQQVKDLRILIVRSRFNEEIVNHLFNACSTQLMEIGILPEHVITYEVPGALEIPVTIKKAISKHHFDCVIALGCIIKGDTYHFEIVANESARGITDVAINTNIPIVNQILTLYTKHQAHERIEVKGRDSAFAAIEMAQLFKQI